MLVPLTRKAFKQLIPLVATGTQYSFYWGKWRDLLQRLFLSLVLLIMAWLLGTLLVSGWLTIQFVFYIITGSYWLWAPILWASIKNMSCLNYQYCGFWRGRVLDIFTTEELVREEQTVNKFGELIIIKNKRRLINIEVGDNKGFKTTVKTLIDKLFQSVRPGDFAEMLVLSQVSNLSRIAKTTDVYLPQHNLWVGKYPYLRHDIFKQISKNLKK